MRATASSRVIPHLAELTFHLSHSFFQSLPFVELFTMSHFDCTTSKVGGSLTFPMIIINFVGTIVDPHSRP